MNLLEDDLFDYWCPKCNNYVLLEKNRANFNMLDGTCALCGQDISILYEDWEEAEKKRPKEGR